MSKYDLKLGAYLKDNVCTFSIYYYSEKKDDIFLYLYENIEDNLPKKVYKLSENENKFGNIWRIRIDNIKEGSLYNWSINNKIVLDPYALAFTGNSNILDKKAIVIRSEENFPLKKNLKNKKDLIIYETHIGLFTKNKNSNVNNRGTYSGFIEKIPYLKNLGVNCIEFLPVFEFDDLVKNKTPNGDTLRNVWGYNPINFFALSKKYSSDKNLNSFNEIKEFKNLVSELHKNGIEVILDLVYNHTAESGLNMPEYNFKILADDVFYSKNEKADYLNLSGCGNTLNCNHKIVKDMIIDSLLYCYLDLNVDGFRFDLASILGRNDKGHWIENSILKELAEHPILSQARLISESWDIGGYFVGKFPNSWSEWNGIYRDTIRKFIKGEFGQVEDLTRRLTGSLDVFKNSKSTSSSINFITCHDGFTMWDLLSYNEKHNLENGENNRDGENNNNSYNYGFEGETNNLEILSIRKQQLKNMLLILFISQGIPMILMGDEIARTQNGNNNAYCQDNITTWFDWNRKKDFEDIFSFTKNMINFRKKYSTFRKDRPWEFNKELFLHGVNLNQPDLSYYSLSIAFQIKDLDEDKEFYIALNSYTDGLNFELPKLENKKWFLLTDTSKTNKDNFLEKEFNNSHYKLDPRSSIIMIAK